MATTEMAEEAKENPRDEELHSVLSKVGLDDSFWVPKLRDELSITKYNQLKNIGRKELIVLKKHVPKRKNKSTWEETAWERLIEEVKEPYHVKIKGEAEKNQEKADKILKELDELVKARQDKGKLLEKTKALKEALDLPENWVGKQSKFKMSDVVANLQSELGEIQRLSTSHKHLSDAEVVKKASGSLALRGILKTASANILEPCDIVLEVPKNAELLGPIKKQTSDVHDFTSREQSDHFSRSFEMLGSSFATHAKGSGWGFDGKLGYDKTYNERKDKKSEKHESKVYLSRETYSHVPTACCQFDRSELKLSSQALKELMNIDTLVREGSSDYEVIKENCISFLKRFGSHINTGPIHFGGVFEWKTTYWGESRSGQNTTQNVVQDAHNAFTNMSYSGFGFSGGVSLSGDYLKDHIETKGSYANSELSNVRMNITKNGGPQEVNSEGVWRNGLVQWNDTWSVIDRGDLSQFTGIWEILSNHSSDLTDVSNLALLLEDAYEQFIGRTQQIEKLEEQTNELKSIRCQCIVWTRQRDLSKQVGDYLQTVLETGERTILAAGNDDWMHLLESAEVSEFLLCIRDVPLTGALLQSAKYRMEKIVNLVGDENFPSRDELLAWIHSDQQEGKDDYIPSIMTSGSIKDVPGLLHSLQTKLIPLYEIKYQEVKEGDKGVVESHFKKDLLLTFRHVITNLEQSQDTYQLFFLISNLLKISYIERTSMLEDAVSVDHLKHFVSEMSKQWVIFEKKCTTPQVELEAFLVDNAARFMQCPCAKYDNESELIQWLKRGERIFSSEVKQNVHDLTDITQFHRQKLIDKMEDLVKKTTGEQVLALSVLKTAIKENRQSLSKERNEPSTSPTVDKKSNAGKILEHLGLVEYYPAKISLQTVMSLCSDTVANRGQASSFAMGFLQKLIMLDYRTRDQDACTSDENKETNLENEEGDSIEDLFADMPNDGDDSLLLHPLDTFLAIFYCCDLMLRQVVAQKMFKCRLALPFIVPDLHEDTYMFPLWALRGIVVEWKLQSLETHEAYAVSEPTNTVSFVRIGKPQYSKSKLINQILSDHAHNTFCNVDSPLGSRGRLISEKSVEVSWFLPAGKETDIFKNMTTILNLRGDASECKQNVETVSTISDVMVAVVCPTDLAEEHIRQTLLDIHKQSSKVILLLVAKDVANLDREKLKQPIDRYNSCLGAEEKRNRVIVLNHKGKTERNMEEIKLQLIKAFAQVIPQKASKSIEDACETMKNGNISIDEMGVSCQRGKRLAKNVRESFSHSYHEEKKKSELLPLQAYWAEWSELLKKQRRSKGATTLREKEELQDDMNKKRKQQMYHCENPTPVVKSFLRGLIEAKNPEETHFFLQWLKFSLDSISRKALPAMQKKLQEEKISKGIQSEEVKLLVRDLKNASLGLEHFFREIGQMYEAVESSKDVDENTKKDLQSIPERMGKLILSGYPIEIMDGDASNVPITWLKAVLSAVKKQLKRDAKVLVLSVLGIQSSGKSTLLNTMFGLQFAVSAGRCTQGVYAQLVSICQGVESTLPFDYILVVDTEGLRAPDLFESDYCHDNELATFVVGLGDMTMVNIKGENVEEVKDILQIVAHAFLRMKRVSKGTRHNKSCMFVHQNVSAINAEDKMMDGNLALTSTLDNIVKEAAIMEENTQVTKFNQVIAFDLRTHIWCLPDLFIGDPPMAAVNPGYSESVQNIKSEIVKHASKSKGPYATIEDCTDRLNDLWDAILTEDFVFSFRNSRAARAYAFLDKRYSDLKWEFEMAIQKWKNNTAKPYLESCSSSNLQQTWSDLKEKLRRHFSKEITEACNKLGEIFEGEWKDILIQWKSEKMHSLKLALTSVLDQTYHDVEKLKASRSFTIKKDEDQDINRQEIIKKAQAAAQSQKGQKDKAKMDDSFEELWVELTSGIQTQVEYINVLSEVESALWESFAHKDQSFLAEVLELHPLQEKVDILVGAFMMSETKEYSWHKRMFSFLSKLLSKVMGNRDTKSEFTTRIHCLLSNITDRISTIVSEGLNFEKTTAKDLINYTKTETQNSFTSKDEICGTLTELQIQVAVQACRYAIPLFKDMHERYKNEHSISAKLLRFKTTTYQLFKHEFLESEKELLAADLIINEHMEESVKRRVIEDLNINISNHLRAEIGCTKYSLIVKVLKHLASSNNFQEYTEYLENTKDYVRGWLHKYENKELFGEKKKFSEFATILVRKKIFALEEGVKNATAKSEKVTGKTERWLAEFSACLRNIVNPDKEDMKQVAKIKFNKVTLLQKLLLEHLTEMEHSLLDHFQHVTYDDIQWKDKAPSDLVCDSLWGCGAQCPFCHETCQKTDPNHSETKGDNHECLQHRPQGISGTLSDNSYELVLQSCSFDIHANTMRFACKGMSSKCSKREHDIFYPCHPYGEYKTAFPDWDITPSATMDSSKYWMWFVAQYANKLSEYFNAKKPDIPPSWLKITKAEAEESLAEQFSGRH